MGPLDLQVLHLDEAVAAALAFTHKVNQLVDLLMQRQRSRRGRRRGRENGGAQRLDRLHVHELGVVDVEQIRLQLQTVQQGQRPLQTTLFLHKKLQPHQNKTNKICLLPKFKIDIRAKG